ncbi:filamentous hemagglutinin N-terminal domain-containing protein [Pantoea sp. C2G6]|uniref:filamentous hemagglutinin N-terminal domain-containing protein n=1 Tax=Pantoea sp. C2G6 TaxID=3243084 RepID=UPI003ED93326
MKKHTIKGLFVAILAALGSHSASAALNSYTHANGSTVVNINQADANGLSHNMYQDFNVTSKGMILNNSTQDLVRDSGNIALNSNLTSSATLILNEVISKNASALNGSVEVAGQKADVIIANPNGITCSGCSFINTGRATLTTGTPKFTDGELTSFKVANGTVSIIGNGLKGADYTDLMARKINIQGMVDTSQLKAIAGIYDYDVASGVATSSGATQIRSNGIDVSALGGATAGIIQLQTTDAGVGVNNNGVINANSLYISSNGALTNKGTLEAGLINASASGVMTNTGTLSATQAALQTNDAFVNNGTIKTTGAASIVSIGKFTNSDKATISADGDTNIVSLIGNVENKGAISTSKTLAIQTGYSAINGAGTAIANTSLLNSGSMQAGNISLNAVKEISLLSGGKVSTSGAAYLSAAKVSNAATLTGQSALIVTNAFKNEGEMQTTGLLNIYGKNGITNTGTLKAGTLTLATDEKISNASCFLWLLCTPGTMTADKITITAPKIASINDLDGNYVTNILELNTSADAATNSSL